MKKKKPQRGVVAKTAPPVKKYFVAPLPETPPRTVSQSTATPKESAGGATKYFVRPQTYPDVSALDDVWWGTGPDLPPHYEGAEACPDCTAFKFSKHAALCIRHPNSPWSLALAWDALHTKKQIFFGVGHPIVADADSYMTMERQRALVRGNIVVLYEDGKLFAPFIWGRNLYQQWSESGAGKKTNTR